MNNQIKIALAGNPNSGKTTLFNALTGSNQFVGNWPGVTVEKKEGRLRKHEDVVIMDLPGIYSLSPYTLEEVVARNYLIDQRPDAILNIIDGTNLERNLYLTTQLTELGIPVVVAINMMDVVRKNGDKIDTAQLSEKLGCRIVEISALKGDGVMEAAEAAIKAAHGAKTVPMHTFSGPVEHAIAHIEEAAVHNMPLEQQRWYAIKIFERDDKVLEKLDISKDVLDHIDSDIKAAEKELDDDAESIITNERYVYIAEIIKCCYKKKNQGRLSASDKIDRVVTNRWLGLPIFAAVMFLVYYIAMVTVGASATDWANDGLFGDGWHLFGIGSAAYNEVAEEYGEAAAIVDGYEAYVEENGEPADGKFTYEIEDEETLAVSEETATLEDYEAAKATLQEIGEEPDPADYGVWVPGVPVLIESALDKGNCAEWLRGLILDGIVAGVGAVLGFVPQMLVLFLLLALPVIAVAAAMSPAGVVADSHTMEPTGEAMEVWERLPDDLSMERRMVVTYALALVDKVDYFWGGKSLVLGWDDRWGELTKVTAEGSDSTGTEQPYGLDCSGFVDWAFYNASGGRCIIGQGGGAAEQHANCVDIEWDEVQPGDLLFYPEDEHVGIAAGRDWLGRLLVVHCASGTGGVAISHRTGFKTAARPMWYGDE